MAVKALLTLQRCIPLISNANRMALKRKPSSCNTSKLYVVLFTAYSKCTSQFQKFIVPPLAINRKLLITSDARAADLKNGTNQINHQYKVHTPTPNVSLLFIHSFIQCIQTTFSNSIFVYTLHANDYLCQCRDERRNLVQFARRRRAGELSTNPVFHKLYEVSFLTSRIP